MIQYIRAMFSEPLLRFCAIGVAVFILHAVFQPAGTAPDGTVIISQARIDAWRGQFRQGNGRAPDEAEVQGQIDQWIDEEVLYQQALALGLHRNDSIVRRQLIQKMDFVIEGASPLPEATDDELQAWLDTNAERYGHPPTVTLEQVFLSRGRHGNQLPDVAEQTLASLRARPDDFVGIGDSFIAAQRIGPATALELRRDFGKKFVDACSALPLNEWQGPVESGFGVHLVRVTAREPFRPALLSEVRQQVELDYRLHRQELARRETLDALREQFEVRVGNAQVGHG